MSGLLQKIVGGVKPSPGPVAPPEDDFADFASAPEPVPINVGDVTSAAAPAGTEATAAATALPGPGIPYTKWYRVWERTSPSDFYAELLILPFVLLLAVFHLWGSAKNRRKARSWMQANTAVLGNEFASVGFHGRPINPEALQKASNVDTLYREKSKSEYTLYATGRQNIAFLDIRVTLVKRYNPLARFAEAAMGFFFESMPGPEDRVEAVAYAFDGKEGELAPSPSAAEAEAKTKGSGSAYDGFVWAIVHKDEMKRLRNERYDLSLTTTKDNAKLPDWLTIMTESAEITDTLLTADLVAAVKEAGEDFEALIVSDQPVDQPTKIEETISRKRVSLFAKLPRNNDHAPFAPVFQAFLRLPDKLATSAHFRPEVQRRLKSVREEQLSKIKRVDNDEKAEERRLKAEKERKERRDEQLKAMTPEQQRKFLEKERATDLRRSQKRRTMRS